MLFGGARNKIKALSSEVSFFIQNVFLRQIDNRYATGDGIISIHGFSHEEEGDCIFLLPDGKSPLYATEISGFSSLPKHYDMFSSLAEGYAFEDDARIVIFYTKSKMNVDGDFNAFCTKDSAYIFSENLNIIEEISSHFDAKLLDGREIMRAVLEIGFSANFYNADDAQVFSDAGDIPFDTLSFVFKSVFAEGVYSAISKDKGAGELPPMGLYQATGHNTKFVTSKKPHLINALRGFWHGYISIELLFSQKRVKSRLNSILSEARAFETDKFVRKSVIDFIKNVYPSAPEKFVIANIVVACDDQPSVRRIGNFLNLSFVRKHIGAKDIFYKTPIRVKDSSFDFVMESSIAGRYIGSSSKKHTIESKRSKDFYGRDLTGNFTSYSFSDSSTFHWSIIARTGSGKSFFILNMIKQSCGIKFAENERYYEVTKEDVESGGVVPPKVNISSLGSLGKTLIVHFDVGRSGIKFVKGIKSFDRSMVHIMDDDISTMRLGLTNIRVEENGKLNESDILFMLSIVSLVLSLSGEEGLSTSERLEISEATKNLLLSGDYEGLSLSRLKKDGGYDDVLEEIYRRYGKDVDDLTLTTDIEFDEDLRFLSKPLPRDVVAYLRAKASNALVSDLDKGIALSAAKKLDVVSKNPFFGGYNKLDIEDVPYFYMELERIKSLDDVDFIPIFLMMFKKLYDRDMSRAHENKKNGFPTPKVIYIIEEAHNLFKIPDLTDLFKVVVREARKHNIFLGFITQNAEDIPQTIINNIGTRMIVPSGDTEAQISQLKRYWSQPDSVTHHDEDSSSDKGVAADTRTISFFKEFNRPYHVFFMEERGVSVCFPPIGPKEAWMFDTNTSESIDRSRELEEWEEAEDGVGDDIASEAPAKNRQDS